MNESFLVRFKAGNKFWTVSDLSRANGIKFAELQDDEWHALTFEFDARNDPVSQGAVNQVRSNHGWLPWQFDLSLTKDPGGSGIRVAGVDAYGLPPAYYWCRVRIQDVKISGAQLSFGIDQNATDEVVVVNVTPDDRDVKLHLDECHDMDVSTLLSAPGPDVGETLEEWLLDVHSPKEKACALNVLAALRVRPDTTTPFIQRVESIFRIRLDRIYANIDPALHTWLETLSNDPALKVYAEGEPHAPIHQQLLQSLPVVADRTAGYTLASYRAEGRPSLQAVVAVPPAGYPQRFYADFDLDLGNPLQDVVGFAIHMGELLSATLTDHLALWKDLEKTPAGDYLYYEVV